MAQQQQNVTISAPGFMGLNTQMSPVQMPPEFASQADNCVIDHFGRVAVRDGFVLVTQNGVVLNGEPLTAAEEFIGDDNGSVIFVTGNHKIWRHTKTDDVPSLELIEMVLPYTATGDDWDIVPFNNKCYFVQKGHQPVYYDHDVGTDVLVEITNPTSGPTGLTDLSNVNTAVAAFGRLWMADIDTESSIVGWSALLDGTDFETSSGAGQIDLHTVWPRGNDSVVCVTAHNDFLIIFGRTSILVYHVPAGGDSITNVGPDYMTLEDTVSGLGCVSRDAMQAVGTDLLFLDTTGLRSLRRTIQEKSMPIGDVSGNIKIDITTAIQAEGTPAEQNTNISGFYDQENSLFHIFFPTSNMSYVFDTRQFLEDGTARVTRWPSHFMICGGRGSFGNIGFGGDGGLYAYRGNTDFLTDGVGDGGTTETPIEWKYYTHPLNFGDPSRDKFPKQVDATVIGASNTTVSLKWAFEYGNSKTSSDQGINAGGVFEYGLSEFGTNGENTFTGAGPCEYSGGVGLSYLRWNIWGHGRNIKLGFEASVSGTPLSLQELNIQALMGRIR